MIAVHLYVAREFGAPERGTADVAILPIGGDSAQTCAGEIRRTRRCGRAEGKKIDEVADTVVERGERKV